MNYLSVGSENEVMYPDTGFLCICDEVPDIEHARVFDPHKHSFNAVAKMNVMRAREIANVMYTMVDNAPATLTVRDGRRALRDALLKRSKKFPVDRFDKIHGDEEVEAMVHDVLVSPLAKRVLCREPNFFFNRESKIFARLNRAEIGDEDALALGLLLISSYKGQIIIPDFGFYGRDPHTILIRQKRLIAGLLYFDELKKYERIWKAVRMIETKEARRAIYADAVELAKDAHLVPDTIKYNDFIDECMA